MAQQTLNSIGLIDFISVTGSTVSMSGLGLEVSIFLGVLVTLCAASLSGLSDRSVSTRPNRILGILSRRAPVEICQNVVDCIVISMATPQTFRPWTFENGKHESVHGYHLPFSLAKERNGIVPTTLLTASDKTLRKYLALEFLRKPASANNFAIHGSNATMVRDFVTGIVGNGSPLFVSHDATVTLSMQMSGDNT